MPTNPDWLEHTERAAWDTVKSLREQIEQERQRVARLAPAGENWQRILTTLDSAKAEHGIDADRYAEILDTLCSELSRVKADRDALAQKLEERERQGREAAQRVEVIHRGVPPTVSAREQTGITAWFFDRIEELRLEEERQGRSPNQTSYEKCLAALEVKLEELEDASRREAATVAVEIGMLALRIAQLGQHSRPAIEDEDF